MLYWYTRTVPCIPGYTGDGSPYTRKEEKMPRQARRKSESGLYHVMMRGINHQTIFYDQEDFNKFLDILAEYKASEGFKIFAYCLMNNHIHLLIKEEKSTLEQIFKKIGVKFVYWYNVKYNRIGHLFQDRFKSEPVNNDKYLLTVMRYIHQNPIKAGISQSIENYDYSSYQDYLYPSRSIVTDTDFILSMMNIKEFVTFNNEYNNDRCLELENIYTRLTDNQAEEVFHKVFNGNPYDFQKLRPAAQMSIIEKLRIEGLSARQIIRLTGYNYYKK
jgi:REP element-mobilizing transposase RayT